MSIWKGKCDRCGEPTPDPITGATSYHVNFTRDKTRSDGSGIARHETRRLCKACAESFVAWMKSGEKEDS